MKKKLKWKDLGPQEREEKPTSGHSAMCSQLAWGLLCFSKSEKSLVSRGFARPAMPSSLTQKEDVEQEHTPPEVRPRLSLTMVGCRPSTSALSEALRGPEGFSSSLPFNPTLRPLCRAPRAVPRTAGGGRSRDAQPRVRLSCGLGAKATVSLVSA